MRRFFVPPELLATDQVEVPEEVLRHLQVLRLRPGENILLLDGTGLCCRCRLSEVTRKRATVRVESRTTEIDTALPVRLLQGLPKGEKMELVLQKGTELGVTVFAPVASGRAVPDRTGPREAGRSERWQRIVREAARQCRRPILPELLPPAPLAAALAATTEPLRLMLWEEASRPLHACLPAEAPAGAAVLVGPEGGFSPEEAETARQAGFLPVGLGPRILRSETAGFAVAAILQFRYGDLGRAAPAGSEGESE